MLAADDSRQQLAVWTLIQQTLSARAVSLPVSALMSLHASLLALPLLERFLLIVGNGLTQEYRFFTSADPVSILNQTARCALHVDRDIAMLLDMDSSASVQLSWKAKVVVPARARRALARSTSAQPSARTMFIRASDCFHKCAAPLGDYLRSLHPNAAVERVAPKVEDGRRFVLFALGEDSSALPKRQYTLTTHTYNRVRDLTPTLLLAAANSARPYAVYDLYNEPPVSLSVRYSAKAEIDGNIQTGKALLRNPTGL